MERKTKIFATFGALLVVAVGGFLALNAQDVSAGHALEDGCTDATDGDVVISIGGIVAQFNPSCVIVDNQQQITWDNKDGVSHDPGDGVNDDREIAFCFQAGVDIEDANALQPGNTYSIELRFDNAEETLYLEKAWHNGERQDLNGADEGFGTIECDDVSWDYVDDDTIRIDYICHIHPDTMHGVIQMNI